MWICWNHWGWLGYGISELLLRAKFGATTGVRNQARFRSADQGAGFTCPYCKSLITRVVGATPNSKLHGVQWLAHCLHDCSHAQLSDCRAAIKSICDDWMSCFATELWHTHVYVYTVYMYIHVYGLKVSVYTPIYSGGPKDVVGRNWSSEGH